MMAKRSPYRYHSRHCTLEAVKSQRNRGDIQCADRGEVELSSHAPECAMHSRDVHKTGSVARCLRLRDIRDCIMHTSDSLPLDGETI